MGYYDVGYRSVSIGDYGIGMIKTGEIVVLTAGNRDISTYPHMAHDGVSYDPVTVVLVGMASVDFDLEEAGDMFMDEKKTGVMNYKAFGKWLYDNRYIVDIKRSIYHLGKDGGFDLEQVS